jgi:hypothetical protein
MLELAVNVRFVMLPSIAACALLVFGGVILAGRHD